MKRFLRSVLVALGFLAPQEAPGDTGFAILKKDFSPAQLEPFVSSLETISGVSAVTLGPVVTQADYERRLEIASDIDRVLNDVLAPYATSAGPAGLTVMLGQPPDLTRATGTPDVRQYVQITVLSSLSGAAKQKIANAIRLNPMVLDLIIVVPSDPTDYLARRRVHLYASQALAEVGGKVGLALMPPLP